MPGDGQNNYKTWVTNRLGIPIKVWNSSRFDLRWRFKEVVYKNDTAFLFMDVCFEGCSPVCYIVNNWSVKEFKTCKDKE